MCLSVINAELSLFVFVGCFLIEELGYGSTCVRLLTSRTPLSNSEGTTEDARMAA